MDISLITNPDTEYSEHSSLMPNIHRQLSVTVNSAQQSLTLSDFSPYSQISRNQTHNNCINYKNINNSDLLHEYYSVVNNDHHQYYYSNNGGLYSTSPSCNSLHSASEEGGNNDDKPTIERVSDVSSVRSDSSIHIKQVPIDDISMKVRLNAEGNNLI